jgi:hypothetical protein
MHYQWFRAASVAIFLLATIAIFAVWRHAASEAALDLVPWYWKMVLGLGMAWVVTMGTMSAVRTQDLAAGRTLQFVGLGVAISVVMAAATFYYVANAETESEETEEEETETLACLSPSEWSTFRRGASAIQDKSALSGVRRP